MSNKPLHEQIDDFKVFPFLWSLAKVALKLGLVAIGLWILALVGQTLLILALIYLLPNVMG